MRRHDREQDRDFALQLIDKCEYGVAAFAGEEPYCLPLSLVRVGEELYFHCALEGRKLDLLGKDPRVCVSFVGDTQPALKEFADYSEYTTYYESAVVEGTAYEVTEPGEKTAALRALCQKLTPHHMGGFDGAIAHSLHRTGVWGIHMEKITAKAKRR